MRHCFIGLLFLSSISCREVQLLDVDITISGYQLNGTVTTPNGVPVEGVTVRLFYEEVYAGSAPIDTQQVIVTNASKPVDIAVYTPNYQFVRQLFLGYQPVGVLGRWTWTGYDQNDKLVPSGKYLIRYVVDTVIVKYSPVLVDGHLTAVTDGFGRFTISAAQLPVGQLFDFYDQVNSYQGTYEVIPVIDLILRKSSTQTIHQAIGLTKDRITKNVLVLQ